jgi:hypothetical protein
MERLPAKSSTEHFSSASDTSHLQILQHVPSFTHRQHESSFTSSMITQYVSFGSVWQHGMHTGL